MGRGVDKGRFNVRLREGIHEAAKKHAGGWDTYALEDQWRDMLANKSEVPENPEGSFIGFVKWYVKKNGSARGGRF